MQVIKGQVLISPSDITAAAACEFAWLRSLDVRLGRIDTLPEAVDPLMDRAAELGLLHEQRHLDSLTAIHGPSGVVTIDSPGGDLDALAEACEATLAALHARTPVVYQAALRDGDLRGFADFLVLDADGRYVVQDSKLARSAKVPALLQIAAYADILERHGIPIASHGVLVLGNGLESVHDLSTVIPVYRARRQALTELLTAHLAGTEVVAWGDVPACGHCAVCTEEVENHRDLLLVAGLRMTQREKLIERRDHHHRRPRRSPRPHPRNRPRHVHTPSAASPAPDPSGVPVAACLRGDRPRTADRAARALTGRHLLRLRR